LPGWLGAIEAHRPLIRERLPMAAALLGCLAALHVVGVVDDRRSLGPWSKLAVQLIAAGVMVIGFESNRLLTALDSWPVLEVVAPWPSIAISILWLVVVTNAINFLDNMDGLAGGVSAIAAALFLVAALLNAQWLIAAMLALLIGSRSEEHTSELQSR